MSEKDKDVEKDSSATLSKLQGTVESLTKKLEKYEEDLAYKSREVEKLSKSKEELDKMLKEKATTGDPEAMKKVEASVAERFQTQLDELKKQNERATKELKHERVIAKGITKAASIFNEDALELIQSKIERFCDFEDGEVIIKDEKGERRFSSTTPKNAMSMEEFLSELAEKHPSCAKAKGQPGGKQAGEKHESNGTNGNYSIPDLLRMSPEAQSDAISKMNVHDAKRAFNALFKPQ